MWLLTRLGKSWREGLLSVIIDRAVGVGALVTLAFCVFLFQSRFLALEESRSGILIFFGAALAVGVSAAVLAPQYVPALLRWSVTRWIGLLAQAGNKALMHRPNGPQIIAIAAVVPLFSVVALWLLAAAQGLDLSVLEAAALFAVIAGVTLVPFAIAGWGLRELAVTALLQAHGVAAERALLLSISFGLVVLAASSAGAVILAFYSPQRDTSPT